MIFKTYASGSAGNTYTLTSSTGQCLVLDAGIKPKAVFVDCAPKNIAGVLITHQHGDHAAYAKKYAENFIHVYAPYREDGLKIVQSGDRFKVGEFTIIAMELNHDVECLGYLIRHKEIDDDVLYATDTNGIPYRFDRLALAAIEADYYKPIMNENVQAGLVSLSVARRTVKTHNSLTQAIDFLNNNVNFAAQAVLVHLSKDNARKSKFLDIAENSTDVPVKIAEEGLEIKLNEKYNIFN